MARDDDTRGGDGRRVRKDDNTSAVDAAAASELKSFIERIERLVEEKQTVADDIKDVFGEAKGRGYDTAAMRKILALRRKDRDEREEEDAILQTYMAALGMI